MSGFDTATDPVYSDERGIQFLARELTLEICSYLGIHDQLAMRKVCKSWRSYLDMSQLFLSRYVDIDISKMPDPSENLEPHRAEQRSLSYSELVLAGLENDLEHALMMYVKKNTRVVVIRQMDCIYSFPGRNTFDMVGRVLVEKGVGLLFQLVFKDWGMDHWRDLSWSWNNLQCIFVTMQRGTLGTLTIKLTLDALTITNGLGGRASMTDLTRLLSIPCCYPFQDRLAAGNMYKKLPIDLPHHELDDARGLRIYPRYRLFIMAVAAHCPRASPVVRADIAQLCSFWSHCEASQIQWRMLYMLIKSLNEGEYHMPLRGCQDVTVATSIITPLRQLNPLKLNNLTMEILHRLYCLPPDGVVYAPPARFP